MNLHDVNVRWRGPVGFHDLRSRDDEPVPVDWLEAVGVLAKVIVISSELFKPYLPDRHSNLFAFDVCFGKASLLVQSVDFDVEPGDFLAHILQVVLCRRLVDILTADDHRLYLVVAHLRPSVFYSRANHGALPEHGEELELVALHVLQPHILQLEQLEARHGVLVGAVGLAFLVAHLCG